MESTSGSLGPLTLQRRIIAVLACVAAVAAGVLLPDAPYFVFTLLLAGAYVLTLALNHRLFAWLVIALQPSALIVPFLRGRPFFWELCALLAWPSLVVYFLINRRRFELLQLDRAERRALLALAGYLLVLGGLMVLRGVGFRAFGGEQMGGRFYVQQVVLTILPLLLLVARLPRRVLLGAIVTGWAMSLTYLVSDFAFSLGGQPVQTVLYFFEVPTDAFNFEYGFELTGLRRYQSLAACGAALLALLWTWVPLRRLLGRWALLGGPAMLACLGLGLGSGHRSLLIVSFTTFALLTFFQRFWTPLRVVAGAAAVAVIGGALYLFAADLPDSVQRSVSFLPGIAVSSVARADATATLNDRFEVLKLAWQDAPRYWLLGRGFGMERLDVLPADPSHAGVWLQYVNGLFYNGTLGLFLKTGVPGLLCTLAFVWWVSGMAAEIVRRVRARGDEAQTAFDRFCLLLCAQWFSAVAFFYLTHGDAAAWMQVFGLSSALIMACRRLQRETDDSVATPADLASDPALATSTTLAPASTGIAATSANRPAHPVEATNPTAP